MNKRLRRKKRVGEFQELGFELSCVINLKDDGFDNWFDSFVDMIESYGLICGGGGSPKCWSVFIARHKGSVTEKERLEIAQRLKDDQYIEDVISDELIDAWY